ncbi:unnamed protein product [Ceutorhynchus assimilis]|uniref:RRM domain-containing protein n=1 Tax=Ceutorhynchus assimilis TaxID=467358 RepID=A0A9N9QLP8_9CUCU|nr:unnamed protein product [Ceutorhynchus assimilis]
MDEELDINRESNPCLAESSPTQASTIEDPPEKFSTLNLSDDKPATMMSDELDADAQPNGGSDNVAGEQEESKTNLIINYIPENMTEDEIRSLFSSIGVVETCKLVRRKFTGQSLGYAFVDYQRPEDAERAINVLNRLRIQHKTIKVSHARPSSEAIQRANLHVSGIPKKMTQQDFEDLFSPFGTIIGARILYDNTTVRQLFPESKENLQGVSQGIGFIRFDKRLEAEQAIQELNGTTLEGASEPLKITFTGHSRGNNRTVPPLNIHPTTPARRRFPVPPMRRTRYAPFFGRNPFANCMFPNAAMNRSGWTLFVYNLHLETEDNELWQLFGPFGAVQSVKVMRDLQTNQCRGFGFVKMTNYVEALSAIDCLNGYELCNRKLQVSFKTASSGSTRSDGSSQISCTYLT